MSVHGLSRAEVEQRVAEGRVNRVEATTSRSITDIIRANVFTRINAIYAVLFIIVMGTGSLIDGLFGGLIIVNSAVGMIQEVRAKRTLDRLAIVGRAQPTVRRDGARLSVDAAEIVGDDVVLLGAGDTIVVDGPLLETHALEVDESMLTGESDPVLKGIGDEVYSGSFVIAGSGAFRAERIGADAYAQKLAAEARGFRPVPSELRTGIDKILRLVTWVLIPVGLATVANQLLRAGDDLSHALRGMVAALVPMVPEGLVLMTSVAMAVGVIRLGRRQALVQDLPAIEELARVDVVCTDKTGTLTENGMVLAEVRAPAGAGAGAGSQSDAEARAALHALGAAESRPNASMLAILEGLPADTAPWTPERAIPFSSARKWCAADFGPAGCWALGAPDVLLDAAHPVAVEAEEIAASGRRVLLLARCAAGFERERTPEVTASVALVILDQRVRPEARATLEYFAAQDMEVKVISGDNARSVAAVAHELGLAGSERAVDARLLPESGPEFDEAVQRGTVFGRVSPEQKRQMVLSLRASGRTVAMTGDGVNDVLALKDADVGVAMGSGSPASRAVSRIVLLNDSFATLPHIVAEGRRVIGNIERVSTLFLTKTVYSVLLALGTVIAAVPFPFLPRHITIIAWFTIGIPAFVLSLAPNTERARTGFVPRVLRIAVPAGIWIAAATFTAYLLVYTPGAGAEARVQFSTTTLLTVLGASFWVLAMVARPYVWWKTVLVLAMAGGVSAILLTPLGQSFFALDPSNPRFTLIAGICALGAVVGIWVSWRIMDAVAARHAARRGTGGAASAANEPGGLRGADSADAPVHAPEKESSARRE